MSFCHITCQQTCCPENGTEKNYKISVLGLTISYNYFSKNVTVVPHHKVAKLNVFGIVVPGRGLCFVKCFHFILYVFSVLPCAFISLQLQQYLVNFNPLSL